MTAKNVNYIAEQTYAVVADYNAGVAVEFCIDHYLKAVRKGK